jgi:4-amino-4-deoxy-L-arabinose transferase-like glycosyltransferase
VTKKAGLILLLIFFLSLSLRLFKSSYPPLLWDEASLGYNAYSILKTGRDEYGTFLPLIFKSFGDYKPGLYVYLALPFVALFGLNPLAVRLPSILAGSLLPLLLYLFIDRFFKTKSKVLPLLSALILAITPGAIHFSRGAWETNILTFQLLLGSILFFFSNLQKSKRGKYLFLSSLVFVSSIYTYQGAKLITLLLIVSLYFSFHPSPKIIKTFFSDQKLLKNFVLPLLLLTLPYLFSLFTGDTANRLLVTGLFSYPRPDTETRQIISESGLLDQKIFHNRFIFFLRGAASRYFNHFSPRYLIFEGDWQNPRHSAPYIGLLLYPSLVFLVIGFLKSLFLLYSPKNRSPFLIFIFLWLLLSPLPSALSRDSVHAVRSLSQLVPLAFFTAYGLRHILQFFKFKKLVIILLAFSFFISLLAYLDLYFNHMLKKSPQDFLYGYEQASVYLSENISLYDQVVFSGYLGQPYIYYLFYSVYPPQRYQSQALLTKSGGVDTGRVEKIDNVYFRPLNWDTDSKLENALLIFTHEDVLRLSLDKNQDFFSQLIPISPIGDISTFYLYQTNPALNYAQK